ncbi:MAG TPA: CHAT domain-containing protein [Pseudonocardiaceae bacterium]|nr:CHAT domain-containing protein [Pseudonocardiaceae bacterium]
MLSEPVPGGRGSEEAARVPVLLAAVVPALEHHRFGASLTIKVVSALLASSAPDVDQADRMLRAALAAGSADPVETAKLQILLAKALHARFLGGGERADLDAAIESAAAGAGTAPPTGAVRVAALLLGAAAHQARWRLTDRPGDLVAAVDMRRAAARAEPATDQLAELHAGLCAALRDRFERLGDPADLDAAVGAGRIAVRACSSRPAHRASSLTSLSGAYRTRFEHGRRPRDLARAVRTARAAVAVTDTSDRERPGHLGTLTLALLRDFAFRQDRDSAAEAIRASRTALALASATDHPLRPALLANAANALRARHEWTGDLTDLNEAIALVRESVETTAPGHPGRFRRRAGLAAALLRRFEATGVRADVDGAVREARAAFAQAPADHPQRPGLRMNEGLALFRRFEALGSEGDLDDCIKAYRAAVDPAAGAGPERRRPVYQLSAPLRERYLLAGNEDDLDAALAIAAEGARETDSGGAWFNLGMALRLRREREDLAGQDAGFGRAAEAAFARCTAVADTSTLIRASAALQLGRLSGGRGDWATADAAYGMALAELPALTSRQLGWDSRQRQLARLAGLGADAAAVAVQRNDWPRAVMILERARGILIGQAIDHVHEVEAVRQVDERLADEFTRLSRLLTADTAASNEFDADPVSLADPAARRRDMAAQWEAVVEEIRRTVPGQGNFLAPPEIHELLAAGAGGAVVIVNASRHRCDALIVRGGHVEVQPLPSAVWQEGNQLAAELTTATEATDDSTNDAVQRVMTWLSGNITDVVRVRLGPGVDRIWWMPTGALCALPVHAAVNWRPRDAAPAPDRVVSSMTTTLRALRHARRRPTGYPDSGKLVVAMTTTAGQKPLRRAGAEAAAVAWHLGAPVDVVSDDGADQRTVLAKLRHARLVHFACHAITNLTDPASSAVLLTRGRLSVRDIAALPAADRCLVYLSACTTALSGGLLADEAMHLASAFQLIGFRAVIGALWKIDDEVAEELADDFYRLWAEGHEPVTAFHEAVGTLRRRYPYSPVLWAGFVHFGP